MFTVFNQTQFLSILGCRETGIPLVQIFAIHVKEIVDKNTIHLNDCNKEILYKHRKNWVMKEKHRHRDDPVKYAAPIKDSLHYLSLKYREKSFSGLIEDVEKVVRIFEFDNKFSCALMSKILLVRHPQSGGQMLYQIYDGSHRLAYLSFYGLKSIPHRYVQIADSENDLYALLPY